MVEIFNLLYNKYRIPYTYVNSLIQVKNRTNIKHATGIGHGKYLMIMLFMDILNQAQFFNISYFNREWRIF